MKFKTTKKAINENFSKIIGTGYCNMQYLLQYEEPIAYLSGLSDWKCDIYDLSGLMGWNIGISTGYDYFGKYAINYDLRNEYELKAQKIVYDTTLNYEVKKAKVRKLLKELVIKTVQGKRRKNYEN